MNRCIFYVGCYTPDNNPGIKVVALNTTTGVLTEINHVNGSNNSFLQLTADKSKLLAVSEDEHAGHLVCLDISDKTDPKLINQQSSLGGAPCHISQSEQLIYISNYMSGNVSVFKQPQSQLQSAISQVQHCGQGGDLSRQSSAHAHSSIVSADQQFLVVADLGIDQLVVYNIQPQGLERVHTVVLPPASGPRHLVFHPQGQFLYCANELDNQIMVFHFMPEDGHLDLLQSYLSLPVDFTGRSYIAEITVSQDGLFLYASHRGHNSIAVFSINQQNGQLKSLDFTSTQGDFPRHFAISPDQKWLLVANQNSDNLVVYQRHLSSGLLTATPHVLHIIKPVCICFY